MLLIVLLAGVGGSGIGAGYVMALVDRKHGGRVSREALAVLVVGWIALALASWIATAGT